VQKHSASITDSIGTQRVRDEARAEAIPLCRKLRHDPSVRLRTRGAARLCSGCKVAREKRLSIATLRRPGGASVITARLSVAALGFLTRPSPRALPVSGYTVGNRAVHGYRCRRSTHRHRHEGDEVVHVECARSGREYPRGHGAVSREMTGVRRATGTGATACPVSFGNSTHTFPDCP
jgi:hypothetical protein